MSKLITSAFQKKISLLVFFCMFFSFAQQGGKLYLSSAGTGRIYDITGLNPNSVATALTPIATPAYFNQNRGAEISNLAVGYDNQNSNRPLVFMHSNTPASSQIYKNGVAGNVLPAVVIGGFGTNNVMGPQFGNGYALSGKNLYRVYPTVSAAIAITGDDLWNSTNTTIFLSDTFFDYQNNIYTIVENVSGTTYTRYLYQIKINEGGTTAAATRYKQVTGPVGARNATTGVSTSTNTSNIRGAAYLNGNAFVVGANGANEVLAYRIDMNTGISTYLQTYTATGIGNSNLDLASVDYFQPFEFSCGQISFQGSTNYVVGTSSTRTARIPVKNIYAPGTYTINVSGTDITTSSTSVNITAATTYVDVPVTYNGAGAIGSRIITFALNGSTTTCSASAPIAINNSIDSDGDGIPDYLDLDSDNDGILNSVEMYCDQSKAPNGNFPSANNPLSSPAFPKQLLFFDWSGVTLSNANNSSSKTVVHNGISYTAAIKNYNSTTTKSMVGSDINTYAAGPRSMISQYYNVGATGFKEVLYTNDYFTGTIKLEVTITATKDGVAFPVNVVVFDPETTNPATQFKESLSYTTNGSTFTLLEKTGLATTSIGTNITGEGTNTINYVDTETSAVNALYQTSGYGVTINSTISTVYSGGTKQGVGFAVRLYCDTDNDGTPNFLDLDSDGDGCPDAGEGDGKFASTSLVTASGTLSTQTVNKNFGIEVDGNGFPTRIGSAGQGQGNSANAAINSCFCYNDPNTTGTPAPTRHGITLLKRAGAGNNDNWPMNRNSAFTALESNTRGFVITRMATSALSNITAPQDGMMVYDTTENCLKIYTVNESTPANSAWKCYSVPSCP